MKQLSDKQRKKQQSSLYIKGIQQLSHTDLITYFSKYGTVTKMQFKQSGICGFLHFSCPMEADRAFDDGAGYYDVDGTWHKEHIIDNISVLLARRMDEQEKEDVSSQGAWGFYIIELLAL